MNRISNVNRMKGGLVRPPPKTGDFLEGLKVGQNRFLSFALSFNSQILHCVNISKNCLQFNLSNAAPNRQNLLKMWFKTTVNNFPKRNKKKKRFQQLKFWFQQNRFL